METGAENRAQVRKVKPRDGAESGMEAAGLNSHPHTQTRGGAKRRHRKSRGGKPTLPILHNPDPHYSTATKFPQENQGEGLREKRHLRPNLHMLSSSKQKGQDLVRIASFIFYLKLKTATIKTLG